MQDDDLTFVYLIECANGSIYTGVTNDIGKRLKEHIEGKGARYTAMHGVKQLLAVWPCKNRSNALKLEIKVKKISHEENSGTGSASGFGSVKNGVKETLPRSNKLS